MNLYTIGFTKKNAESFFETLRAAKVKRIVDVRLNNVSQLAGFSKRDDLAYFLKNICDIEYAHLPILAPDQAMLDAYKKDGGTWADYEIAFNQLMAQRHVEASLPIEVLDGSCLLCSEEKPDYCHRRLVADIAQRLHPGLDVRHLG
jgi:uncharacterized protein (DUF488 family)